MLELKNVSFKADDKLIIDDVSFILEDGKFLVLTGPNGGGKSTIARLIMGIDRPQSGKILLDGEDITQLSITQRAQMGVGYAFQQPPRFKGLTIKDLISLAHGEKLPDGQCCDYLTRVGLCSKDYLHRQVDNSLSGGEVKRIEIAMLMARRLKLAIYDEPEAGIDLWSFAMLVDSFKKISDCHKSVILISHQERIIQLADDIIVIAEGRIKTSGTKEVIYPRLIGELSGCGCEYRPEGSERTWTK